MDVEELRARLKEHFLEIAGSCREAPWRVEELAERLRAFADSRDDGTPWREVADMLDELADLDRSAWRG